MIGNLIRAFGRFSNAWCVYVWRPLIDLVVIFLTLYFFIYKAFPYPFAALNSSIIIFAFGVIFFGSLTDICNIVKKGFAKKWI